MKKPYNRTLAKRTAAHTVATVQKEERIEQEKIEGWQKATEAAAEMTWRPYFPIEPIYVTRDGRIL